MCAKRATDCKAIFEEKYALYGDMLYKLGIIYFGVGNDNQMCQEAINEAFLWLLTRKKSFKTPEKEKLELIRRMVLICKSKSKKRAISIPDIEDETSENAFCSESMDMLESACGLPFKYRPVIHLALYENLDMRHISKILSIPRPIVKKLHAKGMELMEMVLERKLDREYYRSMLDEIHPSPEAKEELYQYIASHHSVKKYITPRQKRVALLSSLALAAAVILIARFYSEIEYAARMKYILLKGGITPVTIKDLVYFNSSGVFFVVDSSNPDNYQAYTIKNKKLKPLDTRHISGSIDYLEESYPISFYYCEKSGIPIIYVRPSSYKIISATPIKNNANKVLVYIRNSRGASFYNYPVIVDINTMVVTDFLDGCDFSQLGIIEYPILNDDLTKAVLCTGGGEIYYCDIRSSSLYKISARKHNHLISAIFDDDGTVLYSLSNESTETDGPALSYNEYSPVSGTVRQCYPCPNAGEGSPISIGKQFILLGKSNGEYSIFDTKSLESTQLSIISDDVSSALELYESPDKSHIMFLQSKFIKDSTRILSNILIYDKVTKKVSQLNLQGYEGIAFTFAFWYDNEHIAVDKNDVMYVNTNNKDKSSNSNEAVIIDKPGETTLWLFDITRLK